MVVPLRTLARDVRQQRDALRPLAAGFWPVVGGGLCGIGLVLTDTLVAEGPGVLPGVVVSWANLGLGALLLLAGALLSRTRLLVAGATLVALDPALVPTPDAWRFLPGLVVLTGLAAVRVEPMYRLALLVPATAWGLAAVQILDVKDALQLQVALVLLWLVHAAIALPVHGVTRPLAWLVLRGWAVASAVFVSCVAFYILSTEGRLLFVSGSSAGNLRGVAAFVILLGAPWALARLQDALQQVELPGLALAQPAGPSHAA